MPVYIVTAPTQPPTERLVDAPNAASARNHVARQLLSVTVAKGPDLFRIAKAGGEMDTVGQSPAPEQEADVGATDQAAEQPSAEAGQEPSEEAEQPSGKGRR